MALKSDVILGAHQKNIDDWSFRIWAPNAKEALLELWQHNLDIKQYQMHKNAEGYFECFVANVSSGFNYQFIIDKKIKADPASKFQPHGVDGPSQIYEMKSNTRVLWKGIPLENYIFYEIHVENFTTQGTFEAIIPHLDELKKLGITALILKPIAQFYGNCNDGCDVVFPFAVHHAYGGPLHLKKLIDACHENRLAIVLDVVYDKNILKEIFLIDDHDSRLKTILIQNALQWFHDFEVDGLRFLLFNENTSWIENILHDLSEQLTPWQEQSKKKIYLFTQNILQENILLNPKNQFSMHLDAQNSNPFCTNLEILLTKNIDQIDALLNFAEVYQYGFIKSSLAKKNYVFEQLPADNFIVSSTCDLIKTMNLNEESIKSNTDLHYLKQIAALTILSPYLPILIMGDEYGERIHFSHDVSTTFKTKINFSKLNHHLKQLEPHQTLLKYYHFLLQVRKSHPVFSQTTKKNLDVRVQVDQLSIMILRRLNGYELFILSHFNQSPIVFELNLIPAQWQKLFDTEEKKWLGNGNVLPNTINTKTKIKFSLQANQLVIYERILEIRSKPF